MQRFTSVFFSLHVIEEGMQEKYKMAFQKSSYKFKVQKIQITTHTWSNKIIMSI
jgi:hypothetical protein